MGLQELEGDFPDGKVEGAAHGKAKCEEPEASGWGHISSWGDAASGREAGTSSWEPCLPGPGVWRLSWAVLGPEGLKLEGQDGIRVGRRGPGAVGSELGWQAGAVGRGDGRGRAGGEGVQGTCEVGRGGGRCFWSYRVGCF